MTIWCRRAVLAATLALPAGAFSAAAATKPAITVYRTASCGCCGGWVKHIEEAGYQTTVHVVDDLAPIRRRNKVPEAYASCHTAVVGRYAIEGHVPEGDIAALLNQKPKAIGLAVPGMPQSAPGMHQPGAARQPYSTILLLADGGSRTFARH